MFLLGARAVLQEFMLPHPAHMALRQLLPAVLMSLQGLKMSCLGIEALGELRGGCWGGVEAVNVF